MRDRWRHIRSIVVAVIAAAMVPSGFLTAAAGPPTGAAPPPAEFAGAANTVTLITGDRVLVGAGAEGRTAINLLPAHRPGRRVSFQTWRSDSDVYVLPSDVQRLVPRVLDLQLFNVTGLVAAHLDDAHSAGLPLLVQHPAGGRLAATGVFRPRRELASIHATAATVDKSQAGQLGSALSDAQPTASGGAEPRIASGLLAGVSHVWLNQPVHALLDPNLTQIGAPTAWNSGLSGAGVKVAVLDTGIDTSHPDLAGKVAAAADFTGGPDTVDRVGHGTHVAAIIAGTGAASGGQRKGVAFGASLLNGKVLDDSGGGTFDTIIAGMEWAVAQQADVVNLSVGSRSPSDGTDPLSQAVNRLSHGSTTLFVAAAGNGRGVQRIESPGAADTALTVAAVDGSDRIASFSSRGPRLRDEAIKPDITAPGAGIISARAAGTVLETPVDNLYVRASGTSMAAPHVAGAAALLAQQHPDWTGAQVKAELVGTALPVAGVSVYDQGGGRLDLGHAIGQRVIADLAEVDFATVPVNDATTTRAVTVRNTGTAATTVTPGLAVRNAAGQAAPAGLVALSPTQLNLPAGGTGTVTVTLRPGAAPAGTYSGTLTLTPASGPVLRLPVGTVLRPASSTVHIRALDRRGNPDAFGSVNLVNADDVLWSPLVTVGAPGLIPLDGNGEATVPVVNGSYSAMAIIDDKAGNTLLATSLVGSAQTTINRDTTLTFSASAAQQATFPLAGITDQAVTELQLGYDRVDRQGRSAGRDNLYPGWGSAPSPLFLQPTAPVTVGGLESRLYVRIAGNDADGPAEVALPFVEAGFRNPPTYPVGAAELARYSQVEEDYHALGHQQLDYGTLQAWTSPRRGLAVGNGNTGQTFPLTRTEYYRTDARISWQECVAAFIPFGPPADLRCDVAYLAHPAGERAVKHWLVEPFDPTLALSRTGDQINFAIDPALGVAVSPLGDGDTHIEQFPAIGVLLQSMQIYRDGQLLKDGPPPPSIWVPTDRPATIEIDRRQDLDPSQLPLPSSSQVAWTFITRPPTGSAAVVPPVLVADVRAALDGFNQAAAAAPLAVEVDAHHLPGASAATVSWVEFSVTADSGQTWTSVGLTRGADGVYRGQVPAALVPPGGALGTRVRAGDTDGSRVEQTVLSAIAVAG